MYKIFINGSAQPKSFRSLNRAREAQQAEKSRQKDADIVLRQSRSWGRGVTAWSNVDYDILKLG